MAEPKGYLIGTEFYGKLRDVIGKVESLRLGGGGSQFEVDTSGDQPVASPHYLSKTTSAWSKGTSQVLSVYSGEPGGEAAVSGWTVTAWNKFSAIKANKWVMLARCNGAFYVISAEC